MKNSNLDERQEQVLLKIEHNGCWIAFWCLLIAMLLQAIIYGLDPARLAGEWCIFMVLCLYMVCACIKNGIWDRKLKPNAKTNILASVIAAVISGAVLAISIRNGFDLEALDCVIAFGGIAAVTFVLCFAALSITAHAYRKKQAKLEAEEAAEE